MSIDFEKEPIIVQTDNLRIGSYGLVAIFLVLKIILNCFQNAYITSNNKQ